MCLKACTEPPIKGKMCLKIGLIQNAKNVFMLVVTPQIKKNYTSPNNLQSAMKNGQNKTEKYIKTQIYNYFVQNCFYLH